MQWRDQLAQYGKWLDDFGDQDEPGYYPPFSFEYTKGEDKLPEFVDLLRTLSGSEPVIIHGELWVNGFHFIPGVSTARLRAILSQPASQKQEA